MAGFDVTDVGAGMTPLTAYVWRATGADVTLTGFFIDYSGLQIGNKVSITITSSANASFADAAGGIPPTAAGFEGNLSGNVYQGKSRNSAGAVGGVPSAGYPQIPATAFVIFGRSS